MHVVPSWRHKSCPILYSPSIPSHLPAWECPPIFCRPSWSQAAASIPSSTCLDPAFFPLFARLPSRRSLIDATIPPPKSELEEERRRRGEFGRTGPRGGSGKSKHDGLKEENQCCPPPPSPLSVSHQSDIQQASSLPTSFVLLLRSHFPPDSPRPLSLQT